MGDPRCPRGHLSPAGSRYCVICGDALSTQPIPVPAPPPTVPPPFVDDPDQPRAPRSRRRIAWALVGIAAVTLVGGTIAVLAVGTGGDPSYAPLSAQDARTTFLDAADLPGRMTVSLSSSEAEEPFSVDETPACQAVNGAERLSDVSPDVPASSAAIPPEARRADLIVGVDFEDTSDSWVSAFSERVLVFGSEQAARVYTSGIAGSLSACPTSTLELDLDDTVARYVSSRSARTSGPDAVAWDVDAQFDSVGLINTSIRSEAAVDVVTRGPNVLVVDWYRDSDDPTTADAYRAAATRAVAKFTETVPPVD